MATAALQTVPSPKSTPFGGAVYWLKIAVPCIIAGILYGRIVQEMAADWWNEPSYSYGMLIPPLALYIAWLRRRITLELPETPDNRGLIVSFLAALMFLTGKAGAEYFVTRLSMVVLLTGVIWTFWGKARLQTLAFPLLLLACMVPLPTLLYNTITTPLQLFASGVAADVARFFGITVFRDGNIMHLAGISLGVEEACSGLNSLSAMMVASLMIGFLQCSRPLTRLLLFLFSIPLSIAANVLRVSGTAILADYHEEFAMGFYHSFSGWLVFVVGFLLLYCTAFGLRFITDRTR